MKTKAEAGRMRARFIGRDESLDYRYGQVYDLVLASAIGRGPVLYRPNFCPYESWESFFKNWRPLDAEIQHPN